MTHISFHGAAQEVTGSCFLIEHRNKRLLIDCGLFQGSAETEAKNEQAFDFDPASIDYLLLTHAHLDHCGRIPLLVNQGFRGEIITTAATRELTRLVLLDAAGLQEHEAEWKTKKSRRKGKKGTIYNPLFTTLDALNSLDSFGRTAAYNKPMEISKGIEARFIDAGHILGSAAIHLRLEEKGLIRRLLFSGDIGYSGRVILRDPTPPPPADVVIMETTYGDRRHKPLQPSIEELYQAIRDTFHRGGNVIIPTFALERAQEILFYLREGVEQGVFPASMQVFLDSPMAISATEIFRRHPECYDAETADLFRNHHDPFHPPGCHFVRETEESIALNRIEGGAVIMAGSGMCTGGRVLHHLKHHLWRKDSSIIFVGYAARGTLGRKIVDGAKSVRLFGEEIPVEAHIYTIGGFSAHADAEELLAWQHQTGRPGKTFLVHGEEEAMRQFAKKLEHTHVIIPGLHETHDL